MIPKVSIIILNWNGLTDTLECLESVQKINYGNLDVILVDNDSSGNDVNVIREKYGEFLKIIIVNDSNKGFAGGNNVGIRYALENNSDFILLLNNDTIVEPNFLSLLLDIFNKNEKIGIAAPQINYYYSPKIVWTIGGKISKIRGSGFAYSNKNETTIEKKDRIITFASGCCLLIKKEVFDKIGLFDEKFFLYVEDADFCYRTGRAGYKIVVSPKAKIYHKVGSSTTKDFNPLPLYYTTRNRLFFAKKNFHHIYLVTVIYIFATMLCKAFLWLIKGKVRNIISVKQAFSDFLKGNMGRTDNEKLMVNR